MGRGKTVKRVASVITTVCVVSWPCSAVLHRLVVNTRNVIRSLTASTLILPAGIIWASRPASPVIFTAAFRACSRTTQLDISYDNDVQAHEDSASEGERTGQAAIDEGAKY